jgi:spermidine synthase
MFDEDVLDRADVDGAEMLLTRSGKDVAIRIGDRTLMSSDVHDSEDEFGDLVAQEVAEVEVPTVLIGGLGLGFTLRAVLDGVPHAEHIDVAELVPAVVRWNKTFCGDYAGCPLEDRRVRLHIEDVGAVIARSKDGYDAIALDVDNGPSAITHPDNERLYTRAGLLRARAALRSGGVLAVWSAFPSRTFTKALEVVGDVRLVRTKPAFKGAPRYYIWLARKPVD